MTGDLSALLAAAAAMAVASGELPDGADLSRLPALATGTWRPVPPEAGGGPGSYATTLPFVLARGLATDPARVAAVLAAALRSMPEPGGHVRLSDVSVTGSGYLSLTVTPGALGGLAARITAAGPGCARSLARHGTRVTAPYDARLASAPDWRDARERLTAEQAGRLAEAAGAEVTWIPARPQEPGPDEPRPGEARPVAASPVAASPGEAGQEEARRGEASPGQAGPVAEAIAYAGEDAVRFALSLLASGVPRPPGPDLDPRAVAAQHLGNPAYAVRYAHAHAASALRQAADLGLPGPDAERFQPCLLAHPSERVLLDAMSWLPERVAGAARRRQPHVVAAYLDELASQYFGWQEACPVMGPGSVPPGPPPAGGAPAGGELIQARLQLASAARTVLATGLRLLGINAPGRM
jgi:arginyl-tRNA synthetase